MISVLTIGSSLYTYIHGSMTYLCWFLQRSALSKRILANFLVFGKEISTYRCIWRHFNAKDCSKIDILRCWLKGKCTANKVNMSIISFCQRASTFFRGDLFLYGDTAGRQFLGLILLSQNISIFLTRTNTNTQIQKTKQIELSFSISFICRKHLSISKPHKYTNTDSYHTLSHLNF